MLGGKIKPYEVEVITKSGKKIYMEINATPLKKDGEIIGDIVIFRDITSRKKLEEEIKIFLSSPYDKLDAILEIRAGAGGKDAQDWATLLSRMYQRFCEKKGFKVKILNQSFGEPGPEGRIGTKEISMLVKGKYAYGILKGEKGAHRLVRISPFSAQKLRHTSFASVDVIPVLPREEKERYVIIPSRI